MNKKQSISTLTALAVATTMAFGANSTGLKDNMPFKLGVAVSNAQINDIANGRKTQALDLIKRNFNQVVAENAMKDQPLQPIEGHFAFDAADAFVDWSNKNGMKTMGHVLLWHSQLPGWFTRGDNGKLCSREKLLDRMENHIKTVVTHFKGRVAGWDVVNEAVEGDGSYRRSDFYKILGEEFIDYAFKFAHEADPDCELWYNDYGNESAKKNETIASIVRRLKSKGMRIDGVGLQTHIRIDSPSIESYENAINLFVAEGVKVAITEMDISVLPSAWGLTAEVSTKVEYREKLNPWPDGNLPPEVDKQLGERYAEWFRMFRRHAASIDRVTVWGLSDSSSWLNDFPVPGRTDYPLLVTRDMKLKPWTKSL